MRSLRGKSFRLARFSLIRVIFRAVFDPLSSFFAPKPHGHACYAGYVTREAFPVGRWSWRFCFVSTLTLYFLKLISLNRTRGAGSSTISQWIVNWERSMNGNLKKKPRLFGATELLNECPFFLRNVSVYANKSFKLRVTISLTLLCSHSNGDIFTCENDMFTFSRVKISCFRAKAHLVFHGCLYNKTKYFFLHKNNL